MQQGESYDKDPESGIKSTARSKVSYDKDPESGMKSTAIMMWKKVV